MDLIPEPDEPGRCPEVMAKEPRRMGIEGLLFNLLQCSKLPKGEYYNTHTLLCHSFEYYKEESNFFEIGPS